MNRRRFLIISLALVLSDNLAALDAACILRNTEGAEIVIHKDQSCILEEQEYIDRTKVAMRSQPGSVLL